MWVITTGGALVIMLGILVMAGAIMTAIFAGPFVWWEIVLLVLLFIIGLGACMGGSEMKR